MQYEAISHLHFFVGYSSVQKKMKQIHKKLNTMKTSSRFKRSQTIIYKTLVKFIMLVASASKVPIGPNLDKQTKKLVDEFGTIQHIQTWCFWTPQQLQILSSPNSMKRLAICGGNGSGKTMVLKEMAKRRAGNNERVIFIIFTWAGKKNLLGFQLENEFKGTGIEILYLRHQGTAKESDLRNAFVFIDEAVWSGCLADFLKKSNLSVSSGIWMASGLNPGELERNGVPAEFQKISLDLALRTTKTITREVTKQMAASSLLKNTMNKSLKVLEHMPSGKNVIIIEGKELSEMIEKAMKHFTFTANVLICVETGRRKFSKDLLEALVTSFDEKRKPVIFLGDDKGHSEENDVKEEIDKWITNDRSMIGRPLIANDYTVPGFESEDVIGIGSEALTYFISRARVNFVHVDYEFQRFHYRQKNGTTLQDGQLKSHGSLK